MGGILSEPVTAMVVERSASSCLVASAVTMQGWRRSHEDADIFQCDGGGVEDSGVFAILDGHGGQKCAHIASILLKERLLQFARRGTIAAKAAREELQNAFLETDALLREQLPSDDRSGTTVVAAIVTKSKSNKYCMQIAHCGDSRALCYLGNMLYCTEDHKPEHAAEAQRIRDAGGTVEQGMLGSGPWRVDGSLAVSRALGDFRFKPPNSDPKKCKVTALPDVQTWTYCRPGDWLLLACDGVFDVMSNEETQEFISARLPRHEQIDGGDVLVQLIQHCLQKGTKDNCSACLVRLHPDGSPSPSASELLEGAWQTASPAVQNKYADFFKQYGFDEAAKAVPVSFKRCANPMCKYLAHSNPLNNPTHCCVKCKESPLHQEPSHGPRCEHKMAPDSQGQDTGQRPLWIVVGGVNSGGILVRNGRGLDSPQLGRLGTDALVSEQSIQGERLQYTKVRGNGPTNGWVSLKLQGKELLKRA